MKISMVDASIELNKNVRDKLKDWDVEETMGA